jgi:hypothetical protein
VIWNSAVAAPTPAPTRITWGIASASSAHATVSDATSAARSASAMIRIRRLWPRSTTPPATIASALPGTSCIAASTPIIDSGWPSVITAMIGSAVRVIREPNALTAWAAHNRRKSGWRHRSRSARGGRSCSGIMARWRGGAWSDR